MLTELLREIAGPVAKPRSALAQTLGLTENQVAEGIRQLVRAGYLTEDTPVGCESGCGGCMRHCEARMPVFLTLTPKGSAFLAGHSSEN